MSDYDLVSCSQKVEKDLYCPVIEDLSLDDDYLREVVEKIQDK